MNHPLRHGFTAVLAAILTGCSPLPQTGQSAAPGTAAPAAVSTPSAHTASASASTPQVDAGAPTEATASGSARPGIGGVPDPAQLSIPATPRTAPNLGSSRYLQPVTTLSDLPPSPVLASGFSGAKVDLIQKKFGIEREIGQLDAETIAAIKAFQTRTGLTATGTVDRTTWSAMFPTIRWEIDRYRARPALPLSATPEARIEQMISYIRTEALGADYVWGAAGPRKYGYDCSGLMLQAMYSAGIDPGSINVVDHQRPRYPTTLKIYNHDGFKHVPASQAKRGDLLFYGPAAEPERVTHVVLFLGNGYVLEAIPSSGVGEDHFYEKYRGGTYVMRPDAVRVFG